MFTAKIEHFAFVTVLKPNYIINKNYANPTRSGIPSGGHSFYHNICRQYDVS